MGAQNNRLDVAWGKEGKERLVRLSQLEGHTAGVIARQAVYEYEINRSLFRDTVCQAVLQLFQVLVPDGQYDPVEDSRQEEAVAYLGTLLHNPYAAEGIAQAFTMLLAHNLQADLQVPVLSAEQVDEQKD